MSDKPILPKMSAGQVRVEPLTIYELETLMRALERLPTTGDFRFDQAIGLAHDRLLMMWAEARRAADIAEQARNVPDEEHLEAHWRSTR